MERLGMAVVTESAAIPCRAPGVEPVGPFQDGGFVDQQWLVRRGESFVQVSALLYRVLDLCDGTRTLDDIARELSASTEWQVEADDVAAIVDRKLQPLGLVLGAEDQAPPAPTASGSPLLVNAKIRVLGPVAIDRVARVLQHLFRPAIVVALLAVVAAAQLWMFITADPSGAMRHLVAEPVSFLVLIGIALSAGAVHELGHAAALRYGGGRARAIGAGVYVAVPVFYTDVTESYRLGRTARVRTDLGGLYFHLLVATALLVVHAWTGSNVALVAAFLIDLDVARQLIPFLRLDGYWALADLTGIPDLFSYAGPRLRRLLRMAPSGQRSAPLRPAIKRIFVIYIALAIPVIAGIFGYLAWHAPAIIRQGVAQISVRSEILVDAVERGDPLTAVVAIVSILLIALPILGLTVLFFVVARLVTGLGRRRFAARDTHAAPTAAERAERRADARRRAGIPSVADQPADEPLSFAAAIADHLELKRRHQDESAPAGEPQLVAA